MSSMRAGHVAPGGRILQMGSILHVGDVNGTQTLSMMKENLKFVAVIEMS